MSIRATLFSDPACPWAYSATPPLTTLRWRYGDQIEWSLVTIGLRDDVSDLQSNGYTPARQLGHQRLFRDRYGMPMSLEPRTRLSASGRACRAVVATRLAHPGREFAALRAIAFAYFTTSLLMDEDASLAAALAGVEGVDAAALVGALESDAVTEAYEADKARARSAGGGPTDFQGKAALSPEGLVRYTAPSVVFETKDGRSLECGGFQPLEAYDVVIANLDTSLERQGPPADGPLELLRAFPEGLCTQEIALALAGNLAPVDRAGAEDALLELVAAGAATREALGDDALWRAA
jgi:protein-disulfide isomerase-like protein with CxxC motif